MTKEEKIIYSPPVGIAHILNSVLDLFRIELEDKDYRKVIINTSSQPNSNPHLGTIVTIFTTFCLAQAIQEKYNIEVSVQFDELENSPYESFDHDGVKYSKSLEFVSDEGMSFADRYMLNYFDIFDYCMKKSRVKYKVRTYREFQSSTIVRETVKRIISKSSFFTQKYNGLHIRIPCRKCGIVDKKSRQIQFLSNNSIVFCCPFHGETIASIDNGDYIDLNTPLRDLTKSIEFMENEDVLIIMCDGNDWSGAWDRHVNIECLFELGYPKKNINKRIFSPMIFDWSGAKLSKSLYIDNKEYLNAYNNFLNYEKFMDVYGNDGLDLLWNEVLSWIETPSKFFRNYSIQYFKELFKHIE